MEIMRIIFQLFKRDNDKERNYEVLKNSISLSKGIFGPIQKIALESSRTNKESNRDHLLEEDQLSELQKLCIEKINTIEKEKLLKNKNFLYILYRWKERGEEKDWKQFISETKSEEKLFWLFLKQFISETKSQVMGDYGYKVNKKFNHESLIIFLDLDTVKKKIEE